VCEIYPCSVFDEDLKKKEKKRIRKLLKNLVHNGDCFFVFLRYTFEKIMWNRTSLSWRSISRITNKITLLYYYY
jgi:hypothetical protein